MSRKKQHDPITKLFDKRADLITLDDSTYYIRKVRLYDCKANYYGKVCTISSKKYNKNNLHIIREFYETEQSDRIHVRLLRLTDIKMIKTRETLPDGKERKILLIEDYNGSSEYVHSIGPIKELKSDLVKDEKVHKIDNIKVLKLVLKNEFNSEEGNKKVA